MKQASYYLKHAQDKLELTCDGMSILLGVSPRTYDNWLAGSSMPKAAKILLSHYISGNIPLPEIEKRKRKPRPRQLARGDNS